MRPIKEEKSSSKVIYFAIASTVIMFLYAQFILGHFSKCFAVENSSNSLGLSFGYSMREVMAFMTSRSTDQLICYSHFIRVWDTLFPIIYTAMYLSWMVYLFKKWRLILIIPILHLLSDWIENYFELSMLEAYLMSGNISEQLVYVGSVTTILKWSLSFVTYALIIFGAIRKLKRFLTSPQPH